MNLFRSEEHARNWAGFNPDYEETLQPLSHWAERFSSETFRSRLRSDYITWAAARRQEQPPQQRG